MRKKRATEHLPEQHDGDILKNKRQLATKTTLWKVWNRYTESFGWLAIWRKWGLLTLVLVAR